MRVFIPKELIDKVIEHPTKDMGYYLLKDGTKHFYRNSNLDSEDYVTDAEYANYIQGVEWGIK